MRRGLGLSLGLVVGFYATLYGLLAYARLRRWP